VDQVEVPALQAITRYDRERAITITANVAPGRSQGEALAVGQELGTKLPEGTRAVLSGASQQASESGMSLVWALGLGILVAWMVLGAQFNSFFHPITVLTVLPLAIAGAAFALLVAGKSLNIFSGIGIVLLTGIVKKNSIILVDYANQVRNETGCTAREAMVRAGPVRLRPILMTSIATMMAAVPAALGLGAGSEIRTPMAIAVIGGLVVSTLLSLLVVPAFYVMVDGVIRFVKRHVPWVRSRDPEPKPAE
jgi:multidrug efflux pump subunit AcrB